MELLTNFATISIPSPTKIVNWQTLHGRRLIRLWLKLKEDKGYNSAHNFGGISVSGTLKLHVNTHSICYLLKGSTNKNQAGNTREGSLPAWWRSGMLNSNLTETRLHEGQCSFSAMLLTMPQHSTHSSWFWLSPVACNTH